MKTEEELTQRLDALEAKLPQLMQDNPAPGDFWMAFARDADVIEDAAAEHGALVSERIQTMLAKHGHYIATMDSV